MDNITRLKNQLREIERIENSTGRDLWKRKSDIRLLINFHSGRVKKPIHRIISIRDNE